MNEPYIKVEGRELPLFFDVQAWLDVEKRFGCLSEMNRRISDGEKPMDACMELLAATANAGARKHGEKADYSAQWFIDRLTPKRASAAATAAKQAFVDGMARDEVENEEADVDVVAQEIQKKTDAEA